MKFFFVSLILLFITNCSNNKGLYWCGDHPCINKKEKEAYFKKTLTVEVKKLGKKNSEKNLEIEKIIQQAQENEKKRIKKEKKLVKQSKFDEKIKIKKENELLKNAKLEEKESIKKEKKLAKLAKKNKRKRIKEEEVLEKKIKHDEKDAIKKEKKPKESNVEVGSIFGNFSIKTDKFKELLEKIVKKNSLRPYPEINDIRD